MLDNLSEHSAAALYQRFEPAEARRILSRLEWMFTVERAREKLGRAYPSPASRAPTRAIYSLREPVRSSVVWY